MSLKKNIYFCHKLCAEYKIFVTCTRLFYGCPLWKGARVAEEARLESVYTSKAYRGFESPSFR